MGPAIFRVVMIAIGVICALFGLSIISLSTFAGAALILAGMVMIGIAEASAKIRAAREISEDVLPAVASKFGDVQDRSGDVTTFERDGVVYETRVEWYSIEGTSEVELSIGFKVTGVPQRFTIQHKSIFAKYLDNCPVVSIANAPKGFVFNADDAGFLKALLASDGVMSNIDSYPSGWTNRFRLMFDAGSFDLAWRISGISPLSEIYEVTQKLEKISRTAVLFHDRILSVPPAVTGGR